MDFIRFGGVDVIEKAIRTYAEDDYLAMMLPRLLNIILAIGASIAIEEIQNESLNLKLCLRCQEIILKEKTPIGSKETVVLPKPTERVNKVIKLMQNYFARPDVQISALDAIINFSRNPDARSFTRETEIVNTVKQVMEQYLKDVRILWRGCMILSTLAVITAEIAVDIEFTKIHEKLIDHFDDYNGEPLFQQQLLWLLAAFLVWPRCSVQIHKSVKCMEFFKKVIELRDTLTKDQVELEKQREIEDKVRHGILIELESLFLTFLHSFFSTEKESNEQRRTS
jgi:hypothetical protein